jgi:hypothetical protein
VSVWEDRTARMQDDSGDGKNGEPAAEAAEEPAAVRVLMNQVRQLYSEVLTEPVPDTLLDIIRRARLKDSQ